MLRSYPIQFFLVVSVFRWPPKSYIRPMEGFDNFWTDCHKHTASNRRADEWDNLETSFIWPGGVYNVDSRISYSRLWSRQKLRFSKISSWLLLMLSWTCVGLGMFILVFLFALRATLLFLFWSLVSSLLWLLSRWASTIRSTKWFRPNWSAEDLCAALHTGQSHSVPTVCWMQRWMQSWQKLWPHGVKRIGGVNISLNSDPYLIRTCGF